MNFKKILTISIILMVLSISLSVVSADSSDSIDLGEIKSSKLDILNVSKDTSIPGVGDSYSVDFNTDIEIDISKMNDTDKKLLTEAVKDKNTSFILNFTTASSSISFEMFEGAEFTLDGDTLKIHASSDYSSSDGSDDVEIEAVAIRSSDNHYFAATM